MNNLSEKLRKITKVKYMNDLSLLDKERVYYYTDYIHYDKINTEYFSETKFNSFKQKINNNKIKKTSNLNNILFDILKIYDKNIDDYKDIDDLIELMPNITLLSNMVNFYDFSSRNIIVIHKNVINKNNYIKNALNKRFDVIINNTNKYKDKIFIISGNSNFMLYLDVKLNDRYIKIKSLKNKKFKFNYIIDNFGNNKNKVKIIKLKNINKWM